MAAVVIGVPDRIADRLAVGREGRGEGAGRALFEAVVEDVRESPATFLMWTSSETEAAEALYESSGGFAKPVRRWELNGLDA